MDEIERHFERRLRGALRELGDAGQLGSDAGAMAGDRVDSGPDSGPDAAAASWSEARGRSPLATATAIRRRRRPAVVLAAAAAVAAIVAGATVVAQQSENGDHAAPADRSTPSPPIPTRAEPGSRWAVDEIADSISRYEDAPGFGKVVIDYDAAQLTVFWKGTPPLEVAELDGTRGQGVWVDLVPAAFSAQELADAGARAASYLRETYGPRVFSSSSAHVDMSGISVAILPTWGGDLTQLRSDLQVAVGKIPVDIETAVVDFVPADD